MAVHKTHLSKHLLEMKFMKRSALREIKKDSEETQKIDDEHWVLDVPQLAEKESKFQLEPSYVPLENLASFTRMSYKGFNPEIEKVMKTFGLEQEQAVSEEREKEISVDDEEMAERYESLVGTIAKKFSKKRHRQVTDEIKVEKEEDAAAPTEKKKKKKHKKEFIKPADD